MIHANFGIGLGFEHDKKIILSEFNVFDPVFLRGIGSMVGVSSKTRSKAALIRSLRTNIQDQGLTITFKVEEDVAAADDPDAMLTPEVERQRYLAERTGDRATFVYDAGGKAQRTSEKQVVINGVQRMMNVSTTSSSGILSPN